MSWRNRKMFDNLPQGIVSGLAPIPRYKEGGFVNPIDYRAGGTVDYPVGMEAGSLVPEVFESGDQQINEALNNMASVMTPQATKVDMPIMENLKQPAENVINSAEQTVENLTKEYKQLAKALAQEARQKIDSGGNFTDTNLEAIEADLQQKLNMLNEEYKSKVAEIFSQINAPLDIDQLDNVTLLDNELESEIENIMIPKEVKEQDLVAGVKDNIVDSERKKFLDIVNEKEVQQLESGALAVDTEKIKKILKEFSDVPLDTPLTKERMELKRSGALLSGKSLEGGTSGFLDILGQSKTAAAEGMGNIPEREALVKGNLLEKSLDQALGIEFPTAQALTADERRELRVRAITTMPDGPVKDALLKVYGAYVGDSEEAFRERAVELVLKQKDRIGNPLYDLSTEEGKKAFEAQVQLIMDALRKEKTLSPDDLLNKQIK